MIRCKIDYKSLYFAWMFACLLIHLPTL